MSNYILDDKEEVRMAELKDSGERKIFETGATRDFQGKGR